MMFTANSLTPSLIRKLVSTTALALLALTYTRPAFSIGPRISATPVACSGGKWQTKTIARIAIDLPAQGSRSRRPLYRVSSLQLAMHTSFDPTTHLVRVTLQPKDSEGEFLSTLKPRDFTVYEDGVRQLDASVTVERPPATIAILFEHGGRYQALDDAISEETSSVADELLNELGSGDRVAVWAYGNKLEELEDFSQKRDTLLNAIDRIDGPLPLSESNLYDALIGALAQMYKVTGPKALVLVSSGIDTFSQASLTDVLRAAQCSRVPVYVIDLGAMLRQDLFVGSDSGPYGRLDWYRARVALERIARESGGRGYVPGSVLDLPGDLDDVMGDIRARYLITYRSLSTLPLSVPRTVRVEVQLKAGAGALRFANDKRRRASAIVAVRGSYIPNSIASAGAVANSGKGTGSAPAGQG